MLKVATTASRLALAIVDCGAVVAAGVAVLAPPQALSRAKRASSHTKAINGLCLGIWRLRIAALLI
jgi:hypothetical protein